MNYNKFIPIIRASLREDIGKGDITTELIIPKDKCVKAVLLTNENCVVCGLDMARTVFKVMDKRIKFRPLTKDGQYIKKGKVLARIEGRVRPILTAERVALNFLSLLSGIATKTKQYVDALKPYKVNPVRKRGKRRRDFSNGVKIMDTRKTIPGLRELEKYAVRIGGGYNHRMRLDEMVLVKDNHLASCVMCHVSYVKDVVAAIRKKKPKKVKLEIEVKNLKEFKEVLGEKPDIIMLDNMSISDIKKAVALRHKTQDTKRKTLLEVSGGITLKNVRKIATTGVEMISVGDLTHSVDSIDVSLEIL